MASRALAFADPVVIRLASEAFQWRADWALRQQAAPTPAQMTLAQTTAAFGTGTLGMHQVSFISIAALAKAVSGFSWDVVPFPRGKTGAYNFVGAQGQGIAANTKVKDQAWAALQHQVSRAGLTPYVKAQFGLPPLLSLREEFLKIPGPPTNRRAILDSLSSLRPLPKVPFMVELNPLYRKEIDNVDRGIRSAREAAMDVDRLVQARLDMK